MKKYLVREDELSDLRGYILALTNDHQKAKDTVEGEEGLSHLLETLDRGIKQARARQRTLSYVQDRPLSGYYFFTGTVAAFLGFVFGYIVGAN